MMVMMVMMKMMLMLMIVIDELHARKSTKYQPTIYKSLLKKQIICTNLELVYCTSQYTSPAFRKCHSQIVLCSCISQIEADSQQHN